MSSPSGELEGSRIMRDCLSPTTAKERHVLLDALRGLALLGIALANYPEFALWTFLSADEQSAMPTAGLDQVVRFLQYMLVDGKFYTIFSLLFGIGFALILSRHPVSLFVRRMAILVVIGACHLMFLWSGDILLLYAIGGLLLPLFFRLKDKVLLWLAACLILIPVGLDALTEFAGIDFAGPFYNLWWTEASRQGITEENFATWLRDADSYPQMFAFLQQGACERIWEFVSGHRLPKVVGLFIIGYLIGKHRLYARLDEYRFWLRRLCLYALSWGLPASAFYAWSATEGHPWGLTVHSLLYAVSVIPLAFGYIALFSLLFLRSPQSSKPPSYPPKGGRMGERLLRIFVLPLFRRGLGGGFFSFLAAPGRMALTNYLSQSLIGVLLFYGLSFGLGCSVGLIYIELTALAVFIVQIAVSSWWLRHFRFGPLEWIWRMLTYGRYFKIR